VNSSSFSAFVVVLSSVWLPATVVMPSSSTSGLASASSRAMASSCPGSQSMKIFVAMRGLYGTWIGGLAPARSDPVAGVVTR